MLSGKNYDQNKRKQLMNKKVKYVCEKCGHVVEIYQMLAQPGEVLFAHCSNCHPNDLHANSVFIQVNKEHLTKIKNKIKRLKMQVGLIKNAL